MGITGRLVLAVVCAFLLGSGAAGPALADEPGESDEAKVLVLQAIALVVNTPDDVMGIEERVEDARMAPHTDGVQMGLVDEAAEALEQGEMEATRRLLARSIDASPTVVLDPYEPSRSLDGGEAVLLGLSVAAVVGGFLLAWWLRPADTVRQLRRSGRTGGEA